MKRRPQEDKSSGSSVILDNTFSSTDPAINLAPLGIRLRMGSSQKATLNTPDSSPPPPPTSSKTDPSKPSTLPSGRKLPPLTVETGKLAEPPQLPPPMTYIVP